MTSISVKEIVAELEATGRRLERHDATRVAELLRRVGARLARPPRIVLLGEFNSGKSTLANAILNNELLPTSVHANTRIPILIHFDEQVQLSAELSDGATEPLSFAAVADLRPGSARLLRLGLPVERLRRFEIIDTPGLAQGRSRVEDLCWEACSRSHIAIWCTTATQAWKASESALWRELPRRLRRNSLLVVTHADGLHSKSDQTRLKLRLESEAAPHFRSWVMVSAVRAAAAARLHGPAWIQSGGADLERELLGAVSAELGDRIAAAERLLERAAQRLGEETADQTPPYYAEAL